MFVTAFLLGLFGSAGHCVGMCSGVTLVLARSGVGDGWRLLLAHVGRVTTYALLGGLAGTAGLVLGQMSHGAGGMDHAAHDMAAIGGSEVTVFNQIQGALALLAALVAIYMALALIGRIPSPERYLVNLTRRWSSNMRQVNRQRFGSATPLIAGLLWGLLPCGLVLTALLTAAVAATPAHGALVMLSFGVGTWPMLLLVSLFARIKTPTPTAWMRSAAALLVAIFGMQLFMRAFAAWGWVSHLHVGNTMLW